MVWVGVLVVCACTNYNQLSTVVMVRVYDTGCSQLCALICPPAAALSDQHYQPIIQQPADHNYVDGDFLPADGFAVSFDVPAAAAPPLRWPPPPPPVPLRWWRVVFRFFFAVKLSWPLSVFELSSLSEPLAASLLDELDDDDELLELLLESDAKPVLSCRLTAAATRASSGSLSFSTRSHLRDSFGRPRTVLCHTTGKLVLLQKFWVIATVSSRLRTTCHQPPGTNTVSPGFCRISSCGCGSCGRFSYETPDLRN